MLLMSSALMQSTILRPDPVTRQPYTEIFLLVIGDPLGFAVMVKNKRALLSGSARDLLRNGTLALLRQKHSVNHMNHTIRLKDVGNGYGRNITLFVLQNHIAALHHGGEGAAAYRPEGSLAVPSLDLLL
jgi:hypothetical protein